MTLFPVTPLTLPIIVGLLSGCFVGVVMLLWNMVVLEEKVNALLARPARLPEPPTGQPPMTIPPAVETRNDWYRQCPRCRQTFPTAKGHTCLT